MCDYATWNMRQLASISNVVITALVVVVVQHLLICGAGFFVFVVVGGGAGVGVGLVASSDDDSSLLVESSSSVDIENILRKPYEQVCEQEGGDDVLPELQIDQTRPECPLPLNSSSRQTGCLCHFDSSRIECIYADRLAKLPLFTAASPSMSSVYVDSSLSNGNRSDSNGGISWSIDLRYLIFCYRNFQNYKHFIEIISNNIWLN